MFNTEKRVHETSLEEKLRATADDEEIKDLYFIQEIRLIFAKRFNMSGSSIIN